MEKVDVQLVKEETKYGKRTAALLMTILYMATLSPLYLFAEEKKASETAVERFINTDSTYTPKRILAENETKEQKILVSEAPEKLTESTDKTNHAKPVSESEKPEKIIPQESKLLITKKAGGVIELGRVKIEIPAKAVKEDTEISITRLGKVQDTGDTLKNVTEENGGYRFLPKGTKFKKKVLISMPYSKELNLAEGELNGLYTYFYDEEKEAWIKLERKEIDKENCLVKSYTTHFTDMINATLQVPETAGPVDFNINSIKGLEAAKPDAHLIKFNPPQGSNTGDAGFSFELQIPSGRNGMQPQVSVGYSSAAGNGIMGKGFDVNYGSTISIDTRKRLPNYKRKQLDNNGQELKEHDIYIKDGVILECKTEENGYQLFTPKKEAGFEKIERFYNDNKKSDYWKVTDKRGCITYYGEYVFTKDINGTRNNDESKQPYTGKNHTKKYIWHPTEIVDTDGNTIVYYYLRDSGYVYPSKIVYTGNRNKEGNYFVEFVYDKKYNENKKDFLDDYKRSDVRVDARSGEIIECKKLLTQMASGYNKKVNRTYDFIYDRRESGESYVNQLCVWNKNKSESYSYYFEYNEYEKDDDGNLIIFNTAKEYPNGKRINKSSGNTSGFSANGGAGVGFGTKAIDGRVTGGVSGGSSSGTNYTNSTLMDVNGDGILDSVNQKETTLYIYAGLKDCKGFSPTVVAVEIGNLLDRETSNSSSFTSNIYGGEGTSFGAAVGYTKAHTTQNGSTESETGFCDIDGDGRVDIIIGNGKYLKNISEKDGIAFESEPYEIKNAGVGVTYKLDETKKKEYSKAYMIQRPVRVWRAKYDGKIIAEDNFNGSHVKGDIYKGSKKLLTREGKQSGKIQSINEINRGEYLYFVANPEDVDRAKDCTWNVKIKYDSVKPYSIMQKELVILCPPEKVTAGQGYVGSWTIQESSLQGLETLYEQRGAVVVPGTFDVYLKDKWKAVITDEIINILLTNGYFIPIVLQPGAFETKINAVKNAIKEAQKEGVTTDLDERLLFTAYLYDITCNVYRLADKDDENLLRKIHRYISLGGNDIGNVAETFAVYNQKPQIISVDKQIKTIFEKKISAEADINQRLNKANGAMYVESFENEDEEGNKQTWNENIIYLDDSFETPVFKKIREQNGSVVVELENTDYKVVAANKQNENINMIIADNEGKYLIQYVLKDAEYLVSEISDDEMQRLIEAYGENPYYIQDGEIWRLDPQFATETEENKLQIKQIKAQNKACFIGQYKTIEKSIRYNDAFYSVENDKIKRLELNDSGSWCVVPHELGQTVFDSNKDFNTRNLKDEGASFRFLFEGGEAYDARNYEEKFYGGACNWYYGIWQGSEEENPFSEEKILTSDKPEISEDAKAASEKAEEDVKKGKVQKDFELKYYLPIVNKDSETQKNSITKDNDNKLTVDESALIGIVNTFIETQVSDEKGMISVKETDVYYAPYIFKDVMHCNRLGGNTYYKIDGIGGDANSNFRIRKSRNESEEDSHGPSASIGPVGGDLTFSESHGSSYMEQSLQDINGDRIPDILLSDGTVYEGYIESGNLCFKSVRGLNVENLAYYKNDSSSTGVSINPSGCVQEILNSKGKLKGVSVSVGSGGSSSSGTTKQTIGFIDMNGDGLADYVNGDTVNVNIGESFEEYSGYSGKILLQDSSFTATGYSISTGAGGGTQLLGPEGTESPTNFAEQIKEFKDILEQIKSQKGLPKDQRKYENAQTVKCTVSGNIGGGYTTSTTTSNNIYMDINGDGLVDIVRYDGSEYFYVKFNQGNSFTEEVKCLMPQWFDNVQNIDLFNSCLDSSTSTSININASIGVSVNISIPIFMSPFCFNITVSAGGGGNGATTLNIADQKMLDIDGDGLTDHVFSYADGTLLYKKNNTGKVGLLKKIIIPQGGTFDIDYDGEYGTADMPFYKYRMSTVTVNDGNGDVLPARIIAENEKPVTDNHEYITEYRYESPVYDRVEKETYGYGKVTTINSDGTNKVVTYSTDKNKYYLKGAVLKTEDNSGSDKIYDCINNYIMQSSQVEYCESPVALPKLETTRVYEKDGKYIESTTTYGYDENSSEKYGNVTYIGQTTSDSTLPEVHAYIDYDTSTTGKNIVSNPTLIKVFDHESSSRGGDYLRYRTGSYDGNGHLMSITQYAKSNEDSSQSLTTSFTYDETYGNIKTVTAPSGVTLKYGYDNTVNQFIESVSQISSDNDRYNSTIEYNYETQTKTKETDCNDNSMEYEYDDWQRIVSIKSPKDTNGIKAISYEYFCPDTKVTKTKDGKSVIEPHAFWAAVTKNKVNFDSNKIIQTIVQTDGLGGVFRTAKTGVKYNLKSKENEKGWNVSGAAVKDEKGRTIKAGQSYFIYGLDITSLDDIILKLKYATETVYDEKDRETKIITPFDLDNPNESERYAITQKHYSISNNQSKVLVTDAKGNITEQTLDAKGNIISIVKRGLLVKSDVVTGEEVKYNSTDDLARTTYKYDALGQMTSAFDIGNNETKVKYDLLGRKIEISTIDGGTYYYVYDDTGNLERTTNSRLISQGKHINYIYDKFNRIEKVIYPDTTETVYEYGSSSETKENARGRLLKLTDSSGTIEYEYGELGEVIEEKRTLMQHLDINSPAMTAVMKYKSNYLGQMEELTYPDGEKVVYEYDDAGQVTAVKGTHNSEGSYVEKIGYDEFGQRIYIKYGNGIETNYDYKKETRLLDVIETQNKYGKHYQNIKYSFDKVGNISRYTNDCMESGAGGNYITTQKYSYDNLYQLIGVAGETEFNKYNIQGAPTFKGRYSQSFEFDSLGNMRQKVSNEKISVGTKTGDSLNYSFDYDIAEGFVHRYSRIGTRYYQYDEAGNITVEQEGAFGEEDKGDYYKINKHDEDVYGVNDAWGYYLESGTEESRSKHEKYHREFTWDEKNQLVKSVDNTITVSFVYGEDGKRTNKYTSASETLYFNNFWTYNNSGSTGFKGGAVSKHIFLGEARLATAVNDYNEAVRGAYGTEKDHVYYYHSDHLGSAQLVTDSRGDEYQHLEYTPYGETWVDVKIQGNKELAPLSYKFSAKELDEETGFYYYGARYLDPRMSRWISADPAMNTGEYFPVAPVDDEAKKHNGNLPGMGGIFNHINGNLFAYAGNNPIKYTDPTGMWVDNGDGTYTAEPGDTLYDLYGGDWQNKSGFTRDPRTLQVGEIVGKRTATDPVIVDIVPSAFITNSDSNNVSCRYDERSTSERVGDFLSKVSFLLNAASVICLYTGNVAIAESLDGVALLCDLGAAASYTVAGKNEKAAGAVMAVMMDVIPGPYKFNKGAARFANAATGKFVTNAAGRSASMTLKLFGFLGGQIK